MPAEFDCAECGQHIVDIVADEVRYPAICAHCLYLPGWFYDPTLRKMFGSDAPAAVAAETAEKMLELLGMDKPQRWHVRVFSRLFGRFFAKGGIINQEEKAK